MSGRNAHDFFMSGTPFTTPDLFDVKAKWPCPWRFAIVLGALFALFWLFVWGWHEFKSLCLVPGVLFAGSFAFPMAAVVLFMELDIRRNMPFYKVVLMVAFGGTLSILLAFALLTFDTAFFAALHVPGAWQNSVRAPFEEMAKLLIAVVVAFRAKSSWRLNGILAGAAVGAGFAAFESAGYAFNVFNGIAANEDMMSLLSSGLVTAEYINDAAMKMTMKSLVERGFLSPFAHVAWTALSAGGFWIVRGRVFNWRFILLFALSCGLHALWNSPLKTLLPFNGVLVILGVVAWLVLAFLVHYGIREIADEQNAVLMRVGKSMAA